MTESLIICQECGKPWGIVGVGCGAGCGAGCGVGSCDRDRAVHVRHA